MKQRKNSRDNRPILDELCQTLSTVTTYAVSKITEPAVKNAECTEELALIDFGALLNLVFNYSGFAKTITNAEVGAVVSTYNSVSINYKDRIGIYRIYDITSHSIATLNYTAAGENRKVVVPLLYHILFTVGSFTSLAITITISCDKSILLENLLLTFIGNGFEDSLHITILTATIEKLVAFISSGRYVKVADMQSENINKMAIESTPIEQSLN